MSQIIELKVPDIGGHNDVDIIEVAIKVGDTVKIDDTLITLETDKATMDVPSTANGIIKEIRAQNGAKISEGDVIALIEVADTASAPQNTAAVSAPAPSAPQAAAPAAQSAQNETLAVPDIGGSADVDVIDVAVKVGDTIKVDDTLITLETDKATMDVPSTAAGTVKEVLIKVGDKVSQGSVMIVVATTGGSTAPASTPAQAPVAAPQAAPTPVATKAAPAKKPAPVVAAFGPATIDELGFAKAHASPSVRKLARELGVDLGQIKGTGQKNRIVDTDLKEFVKNAMQNGVSGSQNTGSGSGLNLIPWPKVDFAKFGEIESVPLSRIKKLSGANLHRNWVSIPHVTVNDEADITELESFRKTIGKEWEKSGQKLSPLAFIIKAAAETLKAFPEFNSSLDGDNLVLKKYFHIGFAADTPNGLVVPVIKNVDQKGLKQIAQELTDLSTQAREGKLKPTDMQGATFTISSLGGIGGTGFTPIINAPEVAILGVCKSQIKPVWNGSTFEPRLMCPLSLSFDHRVVDGAAAMRFTVHLAKLMADVRRLVL